MPNVTDELRATPIKVGLRLPWRLLLVAKSMWIEGGDRYLRQCQDLLEAALLARSDEADTRASAYANGTLDRLPEPVLSDFDQTELQQITVRLSLDAYTIAEKLGLRHGRSLSIQKVCEPILCDELRKLRDDAIKAISSVLDELQRSKREDG